MNENPGLLACLRADARFLCRNETSRAKALVIALLNRGMQAMVVYRVSAWLWKKRVPALPLLLTRFSQMFYAVDIAYQAELGPGIVIVHGFGLVIGQKTRSAGQCILFHGVTLGDRGTEWVGSDETDGHPTVGWGCMFGAGAKVLGPVTIGGNCVVGANAVVLKDVPANSIAVGVPARVVGTRPPMDEFLRPIKAGMLSTEATAGPSVLP